MPIYRIEELVYGVDDLDRSAKFFLDAGFNGLTTTTFSTAVNQIVSLKPANDPSLPPATESGPTLRELVWGVETAADIDVLAERLGDAAKLDGDTLRTIDPNGLGIGFRVMDVAETPLHERPANQVMHRNRINERLESYIQPPALRMVHVAYNIEKAKNEEALAFYRDVLNFKEVDKVLDTGTFLQSEADIEHHNFFLCFRPDRVGLNHVALEMWNFDAVMEAGDHMVSQGWKESRRPGRHKLGSNVYRFVHAPSGGRLEFVADMDRMDKTWETRIFEKNPGHNLWMLKSSGPQKEEA